MTLVAGMKFNKNQGALIADQTGSTNQRRYDLSDKLHSISKPIKLSIGESGPADINTKATKTILNHITDLTKDKIDLDNVANELMFNVYNLNRRMFSNQLYKKFGMTEQEIKNGVTSNGEPVSEETKREYYTEIKSPNSAINYSPSEFLILAESNELNLIYAETMYGNINTISRPYHTIGSGRDAADIFLKNFVEKYKKEKRENIDSFEGLIALSNALTSSNKSNHGVGTIPQINFNDGEKLISLDEDKSILYTEISKLNFNFLLNENFSKELLKAMFYDKIDFKDANKELKSELKSKGYEEKADLLLRGYKI